MTRIERIESDIEALSPEELSTLRAWFDGHLAEKWDAQVESDAEAGVLDRLAKRALADHKAGRTKPL